MRSVICLVFLIFPASIISTPDPLDQTISDWDSNPYDNLYMDQSIFDNDSGSTLTTDAITDCDPTGIQNAGKMRKRMVSCHENDPSVESQNIPKAESVQDAITNGRPPQIPPGILRYHPDKVPVRDRTHKIPDFWTLPVLAPDSSGSCPAIQEGTELTPQYFVCDSGFDLDVIVNILYGYTILQNASLDPFCGKPRLAWCCRQFWGLPKLGKGLHCDRVDPNATRDIPF